MRETRINRFPRQLLVFVLLLAATALVAHATQSPDRPTPSPVHPVPPPHEGAARIEVGFVLDTTGSMSGLIEGAKQKIWSIASQMADGQPRPEIRVGLIGYRDRGDAYVTRLTDLDQDIDAVYARLMQLRADGGGDTPESVNQALHEAVTRLSWSESQDVYKVIFLVGDAPPHVDYPNDVPFAESVRLAKSKGIVVNTVQCGNIQATASVWKQIARGGLGEYVAIAQDGAMVAMETPHDEELAQLNRDLASTLLTYGDEGDRYELRDKVARALEAPASAVASRLSFFAKRGGGIASGRSDLVDAVENGLVEAEALPAASLPEEMREMDADGRNAYVKEKAAERAAVQKKINEISRQRDDYVRRENARLAEEGVDDGFDHKVLGAIRAQAAEKGITYE